MSTLMMLLDALLSNPAWLIPSLGGLLSFGYKWLAPRAPALHEILAAFNPDVPRLLNGLHMLVNKDVKPLDRSLPAAVSEPK